MNLPVPALPSTQRSAHRVRALRLALGAAAVAVCLPGLALAQQQPPSPCPALKQMVAAAPGHFAGLDADAVARMTPPYGATPQCNVSHGSYQCTWAPRPGDAANGSNLDALQAVAADIAACLPDATHDVNSPTRQHFYLGERGARTEITASTQSAGKLRLVVVHP
jgi:hypothetical protein